MEHSRGSPAKAPSYNFVVLGTGAHIHGSSPEQFGFRHGKGLHKSKMFPNTEYFGTFAGTPCESCIRLGLRGLGTATRIHWYSIEQFVFWDSRRKCAHKHRLLYGRPMNSYNCTKKQKSNIAEPSRGSLAKAHNFGVFVFVTFTRMHGSFP